MKFGLVFALCVPLSAHVISMSTGFATVEGNRVEYILRMPDYEIAGAANPAPKIFDHIRFSSRLDAGRRTGQECHHDTAVATWVCAANYEFAAPVERLDVGCSFFQITVPNHIHMLRAERAGKFDRAILDSTIPSASLAFRPPTEFENAVEQAVAGFRRIVTSPIQLLLIAALAFAARRRTELLLIALVFLTAQAAVAVTMSRVLWQPNPRFTEAAVAVVLAYFGFEMFFFPKSGGRWIFGLLFGAFSGLYFSVFLTQSGYVPAYVLPGVAVGSATAVTVAGIAWRYLKPLRNFWGPNRVRTDRKGYRSDK